MRRMSRIGGRSDDMLIVRGVNVFPSQIEEILLAERRLSAHYVLELGRDGRLDDLTVVSEIKPGGVDKRHRPGQARCTDRVARKRPGRRQCFR